MFPCRVSISMRSMVFISSFDFCSRCSSDIPCFKLTSPWQWLTGKLQSFFLKLEVWRGVNLDRQRRQVQSIWSTISKWFCMEGITVSWAVKEMSPRGNFSRHYHPAYDLPLPWPHLISYNVLPGSFCLNPTGLLAFSQILYTKHTPKPGSFPLPQAHLECFPCR